MIVVGVFAATLTGTVVSAVAQPSAMTADRSTAGSYVAFLGGLFDDDDGSIFESDIEWIAAVGITKGCGPRIYCPDDSVTREQMAAFLARALNLPPTGEDFFDDDNTSIFEADINRLAASGITKGCETRQYCPGAGITREQMAAFLVRALDLPPTSEDLFDDDNTSIFETDINRLAASGITKGCETRQYCPSDNVTRGQMAAFLRRALQDKLGLPDDGSPLGSRVFSDLRRTDVNLSTTFPVLGTGISSATGITVIAQPANGLLTADVASSELTFVPNTGQSGYSTATIRVDWPDGSSDAATIDFYVEQVGGETYFDPVGGDDLNPGTRELPKKTGIEAAINNATAGDRFYLKGGQSYDVTLLLRDIGGTEAAPIVLSSYDGQAILDADGGPDYPLRVFGDAGRLVIENIAIIGGDEDGVLLYNSSDSPDSMNVMFDNVDVRDGGRNGINSQIQGHGKLTVVHSRITGNHVNGLLAVATDMIVLNNLFRSNADTKDYTGGPMAWNSYLSHTETLRFEGNTSEDSEGLLKLREPHGFLVQENTFRRAHVIGIGAGGQLGDGVLGRMENGVIAYNLIEDSQNSVVFGDADGQAGGGIHNVDIKGNVVIGGGTHTGNNYGASMSVTTDGQTNSNFRIFDNIIWSSETDGYGGARVEADDVEFFDNIVGGGSTTTGWQNYILSVGGYNPDVHDCTLYGFATDTIQVRSGADYYSLLEYQTAYPGSLSGCAVVDEKPQAVVDLGL